MEKVILIAGKAQNGKNQIATFLEQKLQGKCFTIAFADYLKFMCQKYLNWNGQKDEAGRLLLQRIGTDLIRTKNPNFHIDIVNSVISVFENEYDYFLIPDVRFQNEIIAPRMFFGNRATSIWVNRIGFDNGLSEEAKAHKSENDLNNWEFDYYINSPEGLANLEIEVDKYIEWLKKGSNYGNQK